MRPPQKVAHWWLGRQQDRQADRQTGRRTQGQIVAIDNAALARKMVLRPREREMGRYMTHLHV